MLNRVARFIADKHLLSHEGTHIVALSGGADSTALLLVLKSLGYSVEAAHCNFRLRGKESDRDEDFCRQLCQREQIPFHLIHFDTTTYAHVHKLSIETAARDLRYSWFSQLRQDISAADVCVAHHSDDNAETVLMNIIRGTGLNGLCGIRPRNGFIVRPLLCVSREDILAFLQSIGQDYVTDSTNLETDATRNKIRLKVLPYLEKINPSAVENINKLSVRMAEVENVVDKALPDSLRLDDLRQCASTELAIFRQLSPYDFNSAQIKDIAQHIQHESGQGKIWTSNTHSACIGYRELQVADNASLVPMEDVKIPEPGLYHIQSGTVRITSESWDESHDIPKGKFHIAIDAAKISFPLTLGRYREGERFVPFGMKGSKLISDFLTDNHQSALDKKRQLVLKDANDTTVWVVGQRVDNRVRISGATTEALTIDFKATSGNQSSASR